jgi:phosphatidylinositol glycan class A protein
MSQSKNANGYKRNNLNIKIEGISDKINTSIAKKKLTIGMISDFFYPRLGGVEISIYQLSCSLIRRGVKVIVITRAHKNRQIIRYMGNGVKVYYLPVHVLSEDIMFPTLYGLLPKIREIVITEGIDIIHMHQVNIFLDNIINNF